MSDRNGGAGELEARWLSREEMTELMKKIREKIAEGEAARACELEKVPRPMATGGNVFPVEEEEQREKLRLQAEELLREGESK